MKKSLSSNKRVNFGKRRKGKRVKSYNKHNSNSTYKKRQGGRQHA